MLWVSSVFKEFTWAYGKDIFRRLICSLHREIVSILSTGKEKLEAHKRSFYVPNNESIAEIFKKS